MTADVELLLPLPEWAYGNNHLRIKAAGLQSRVTDYASANAARATAPLQAEIEALRASKGATYIKYELLHAELAKSKAQAEQLAEALRPLAGLDLRPDGFDARPDDQIVYQRNSSTITVGDVRRAAAALRDHDKGGGS